MTRGDYMRSLALVLIGFCASAPAQTWDVTCPGGTAPNQVSNNSNGHLKAVTCVDSTGAITATAAFSGGGSATLPSGMIFLILTGTCPAGTTEVTALNGQMLKGTLAANGDVGTTGGNATITPAGSISAITQVINHTHTVSITDPGHNHTQNAHTHTIQMQGGTTAATTGTHIMNSTATGGSSRAATSPDQANSATATNNSATTGISASTANPAGGVSSITPTFTGTPVDPSPSFTRVIFCSAN